MKRAILVAIWFATGSVLLAQAPSDAHPISHRYAVDHYPTVRAALEQVNASAAGVDVARAAYLPTARRALAVQSRDRQQHLRPGAAAVGDSRAVGPGPAVGVRARASGAAPRARCSRGSRSISALRDATIAGAQATVTRARAGEALTQLDVQAAVGERIPRRSLPPSASDGRRPGGRGPPDRPGARGAHARRQSAAAGRRSLARGCRARRRADAADSGASRRSPIARRCCARRCSA